MPKVLMLVDEANLMNISRELGQKLDWKLFRDFFRAPSMEIVVYVGLPPNMPRYAEQRERKQKFLYWLRKTGFIVYAKDGSPSGEQDFKSNVDVMMAIDGMALAQDMQPETVILVTGDSDFSHLALTLRRRGHYVVAASVDAHLGNELRASVNMVIDLQDYFKGLSCERSFQTNENALHSV